MRRYQINGICPSQYDSIQTCCVHCCYFKQIVYKFDVNIFFCEHTIFTDTEYLEEFFIFFRECDADKTQKKQTLLKTQNCVCIYLRMLYIFL